MINSKYSIDVLNPLGKVRLVTANEVYVRVPRKDGSGVYDSVNAGIVLSYTINEQRAIIYNFVIGNSDPNTARDLIPCPVNSSTITFKLVSLYTQNGIGLFSTDVKNPDVSGLQVGASIRANTRPFDFVERWINATTGNTVYEVVYSGCWIGSQDASRAMDAQDTREIENLTVHFKTASLLPGEKLASEIASGTLGTPQLGLA